MHQLTVSSQIGECHGLCCQFGNDRTMGDRRSASLTRQWDDAINGWLIWLRVAGRREGTIRLRRDHVRSIARRSHTNGAGELTINMIVSYVE
jgi:hypothetical protein